MTNKPMLSVDRELVARLKTAECRGVVANTEALQELRALLDKPSCGACNGCDGGCKLDRESPPAAQHQGEPVNRLTYSQGDRRYVDGWNDACRRWENKPSPQPTGEPSAWIVTDMNGDSYFAYDRQTPNDKPLYAEQPEPAADHTQCEECKGWGYHENHYEGGGTECGECGGSGNATVAEVMVMPDRMKVEPFTTIDRGSKNYKAGYNAAIAEVAKLNGLKT